MASNIVFRHTDRASHYTLQVKSEPRPTAGLNEVLIQVRGVTLNYRDTIVANNTYPFPVKDNVVPCSDGAGVVVELGTGVDSLEVGDRVISNFDVSNLYGPQSDALHLAVLLTVCCASTSCYRHKLFRKCQRTAT
ncbi:Zinc-type alcohol dehydrogenase-like protein [Phytophthora citrophthora]|uniref:Zinc-type alcohol dehydrogenase-like protein n=1 Tax=Phytophthora citrophthora TaxID=4793 RepID=A0AAD9GBU4_9STRA|nr:Zinc-type alcohol dehydrogenase-like protein [Phytophthora citrophthora]